MAAWPTQDDLVAWVGSSASSELSGLADDIVDAVTAHWLNRIPTDAVADAARPGGASEDCPADLRQVIIMDSARVFSRRASRQGFQLSGDVVARIASVDPDIARLSAPYTVWPEA